MEHLLLTKFNLRRTDALDLHGRHVGLDAEWLDHRIDLFARYCAPSVDAQTSRSFRWLIFVDPDTPAAACDGIARCITTTQFEIVRIDGPDLIDGAVAEMVGAQTVLTGRVDNDDAISRSHIEVARRAADAGAGSVLFTSGMVLYAATGRAYRLAQRHSPFYSVMVEPGGVTATTMHQNRAEDFPKPVVELPMGFLRVIHDRNLVGTHGRVGRRVSARALDDHFEVRHGPPIPESDIQRAVDTVRSATREAAWMTRRVASKARRSVQSRRR